MILESLAAGLGYLITQTQVLSHVTERLISRQQETFVREPWPIVVELHPRPTHYSDEVLDRLIVPPPSQLMLLSDDPLNSFPVIAIVLSDGPASGTVSWMLSNYNSTVRLDLPANAVAILLAKLLVGPLSNGELVLGDFDFDGTIDGYQVYACR